MPRNTGFSELGHLFECSVIFLFLHLFVPAIMERILALVTICVSVAKPKSACSSSVRSVLVYGRLQASGNHFLECKQPKSSAAGPDARNRHGTGLRLYAANLFHGNKRQPVSVPLYDGGSERRTVPADNGVGEKRGFIP